MKQTHIINIGYPKCGTTWCWRLLEQQHWFDTPREKENSDLISGISVADYIDSYANYNITGNFETSTFAVDQYVIKQLSELSSVRVSIILRNNFDIFWSLFNFLPTSSIDQDYNKWVANMIAQSWFHRPSHIIKRWQKYFNTDRFYIFFYDEIQKDSSNFFNNYCKQMSLPTPVIIDNNIINKTRYTCTNDKLDYNLVKIINQEIDDLQNLVEYDLSTWKK